MFTGSEIANEVVLSRGDIETTSERGAICVERCTRYVSAMVLARGKSESSPSMGTALSSAKHGHAINVCRLLWMRAPWQENMAGCCSRGEQETVEPGALRCSCGYYVSCEVGRVGDRLGILMFLDDKKPSGTYGRQFDLCPGCAKRLALHNLLLRLTNRYTPGGNLRECSEPGAS